MDKMFNSILLGEQLAIQTTTHIEKKSIGIGYARVSDAKQIKEGNGLESQKRACYDYAKRINVPMQSFFTDEAVSGRSIDRQGISQAIEYIKQHQKSSTPITHFFTTECSRISRSKNLYDTLDLEREIQKYGAKIVFVNMTALNNEDSGSQLLKTVSYYSAAQESERISERTITGMKNRLLEGFRPFQRPMGYKPGRIMLPSGKEEVVMERDEPIASALAEGLEKFASGELFTKAQLFYFLKENGVKTRTGKKTGKTLVEGIVEKIISPQRLIVYAGYVLCPARGINELIPGKHAPLISLETARAISRRISGVTNKPTIIRKDYDERVPLRGIIYCSECGNKLTGGQSRGQHGQYYSYYNCATRGCCQKSKSISVDKLHKDVKYTLFQRQTDEHIDKLFDYIFNEVLQSNYNTINLSYKQKEHEIQSLGKEISEMIDKIMNLNQGDVIKRFEEKIEELSKKKSSLEEELRIREEQKLDFSGLEESTKFLFKHADRIRDIADQELKYLLIGVRYNGKILYKKNQGVSNPDFSLSTAVYDLLISHNNNGAADEIRTRDILRHRQAL